MDKETQEIYKNYRNELLLRQRENSTTYDKAILTLSMASLGFSISFIDNIISLNTAQYIFLLQLSWILFGASILTTITSFMSSNKAINKNLEFAEAYYVESKVEYLNRPNAYARATDTLNLISGILFIIAIIITIVFVTFNLERSIQMANDKIQSKVQVHEGQPIMKMQKVTDNSGLEKGQPVPNMQVVTQTTGSSDSGNVANTQSSSGENTK